MIGLFLLSNLYIGIRDQEGKARRAVEEVKEKIALGQKVDAGKLAEKYGAQKELVETLISEEKQKLAGGKTTVSPGYSPSKDISWKSAEERAKIQEEERKAEEERQQAIQKQFETGAKIKSVGVYNVSNQAKPTKVGEISKEDIQKAQQQAIIQKKREEMAEKYGTGTIPKKDWQEQKKAQEEYAKLKPSEKFKVLTTEKSPVGKVYVQKAKEIYERTGKQAGTKEPLDVVKKADVVIEKLGGPKKIIERGLQQKLDFLPSVTPQNEKYIIEGIKATFPVKNKYLTTVVSNIGLGTYREVQEHPLRTSFYFLGGMALPAVGSGIKWVFKPVTGFVAKTPAVSGVVEFLTEGAIATAGTYFIKEELDVWKEAKEKYGPEAKYQEIGRTTTRWGAIGLGVESGKKLFTKISTEISAIGKEPATDYITIKEPKDTFPTASSSKHKELFIKGSKEKLPGEAEESIIGFHATAEKWPKISKVPSETTREVPGTYFSPGDQPSTYFLRLGGGEYSAYGSELFPTIPQPNLIRVQAKGVKEIPSWARNKKQITGFIEKAEKGKLYVPKIKSEIEAVLVPETEVIQIGSNYYYNYKGYKVPIVQAEVAGLESPKGKITTLGELSSSYSSGRGSSLSPTSLALSKIKPKEIIQPKESIKYEPSSAVSYKLEPIYKPSESYKPSSTTSISYTPSSTVSKASSAISSTTSKASSKISEASDVVSKVSSVISEASSAVSKASSTVSKASSTTSKASSAISKASSGSNKVSYYQLSSSKPPYVPPSKVQAIKQPKEPSYTILVKRRGIFRKVGTTTKIPKAFAIGRKAVSVSASASFKIVPSEKKKLTPFIYRYLPRSQFRLSKKTPDVFVERREKRIKTPGEKLEITFKGIQTLQSKGRLKKFGKRTPYF